MARYDVLLGNAGTANYTGGGTNNIVVTPAGVWYSIFIYENTFIYFRKSTDKGKTWSATTSIYTTNAVSQLAIWYDRWSGIAGGLIHCVYTNGTDDDINYRSIDTESSDTLSTQTVVFAGASTAAGGALSITRARGGNLVVVGSIDGGTEDGAWKSTDVGATWGATIADPTEGAASDQFLLAPGWNADTQDVMLYFWDASANEISVKRYDDSGNAWTETSIATSMVDTPATSSFPHWNICVDLTNSQNLLAAWSDVDVANSDLRCWKVTDTTITEVTNVVLNSTDDQGFAGIGIDDATEDWYVWYGGASAGGETFPTSINIYYKKSTDDGVTWGSETQVTASVENILSLHVTPRFTSDEWTVGIWCDEPINDYRINVDFPAGSSTVGGRILIS